MTSQSDLLPREVGDYGFARARDLAFDAVHALWRRRRAEGMTQSDIAAILGRNRSWVSRSLQGPANWTLRTFGELIEAMRGDIAITSNAIEDNLSNSNAYCEYELEISLSLSGSNQFDFKVRSFHTNTANMIPIFSVRGPHHD